MNQNNKRVIVIGISGASCSGKSTLARQLVKVLNSPFQPICLDNPAFYKSSIPKFHDEQAGITCANYECKEAYDFSVMVSAIQLIKQAIIMHNSGTEQFTQFRRFVGRNDDYQVADHGCDPNIYVIAEGFLLFADESLAKECDLRVFLKADQRDCQKRRQLRDGFPKVLYDCMVWKYYLMYEKEQMDRTHHTIHSSSSVEHVMKCAIELIQNQSY